MINIEERVEKAKRLFKEGGYNCCQAVVLAYNDVFGISDEIAASIKFSQKRGKTSNMIVLAEGAGNKEEICAKIKEKTGISVKTTTLGHIQRGGSPTMADRVLAAKFAVRAVDLILQGQSNRVIGIKDNKIIDRDISEALSEKHSFDKELYDVAHILSL